MPDTTYFQDVLTTGDTILKQNLTVQGTWTYFVSNLGSTTDQLAGIGSISAPVGNIFSGGSNLTTLNVPSIPAVIGINTSTGVGANLTVNGNTVASNAISTPSVFSTNVNTSGTTNTVTLIATSNVGIGTTPSTGANLYIVGNAYLTNSVTAPNFFATSVNVSGTANIGTFQGSVSIPILNISGVTNLMTVVATSNMGIGTTPSASGANLYVVGNSYLTNSLTASNVLSTNVNVSGTTNVLTLVAMSNIGIGTTPSASGAQLTITGNAYLTNSLTSSNVLSTNVNVSGTTNVLTLVAMSNIGIGTTPSASGAQLTITGNAYLTNSLTTSNVLSTNVNVSGTTNVLTLVATSNIGIGTTPAVSGAKLHIIGNAYLTNALTASNVLTTNVNVSGTTNVLTLVATSNIGIGTTPTGTGPKLHVVGNAYLTNALTASNVLTTNVNVSTTNTSSLVVRSNIGIGTLPSTGANLYVVGNVYVSNTLTVGNIVTTNIYYGEDGTNRSIHLLPTSSNSATIQNWITATCNYAPSTFWSSQFPIYSNVYGTSSTTDSYSGCVYLPTNRVLFVPQNSSNVAIFNAVDSSFSRISGTGAYNGGVLLPNGNVLFVPQTGNIGLFNPLTSSFSNINTGGSIPYSGSLTSNGVVCTPYATGISDNVIKFDYKTNAVSNLFSVPSTIIKFYDAGALAYVPGGESYYDVAWNHELKIFSAVSSLAIIGPPPFGFQAALISRDGEYWSNASTQPDPTINMIWLHLASANASVSYGAAIFTVVGTDYSTCRVSYSYDGDSWTTGGYVYDTIYPNDIVGYNYQDIVVGPKFVIVGENGTNYNSFYSVDGTNLVSSVYGYDLKDLDLGTAWKAVTVNDTGRFVAVGINGLLVRSAYTIGVGLWSAATVALSPSINWYMVKWSSFHGLFVAIGETNTGYVYNAYSCTSADGITWNTGTLGTVSTSYDFTIPQYLPNLLLPIPQAGLFMLFWGQSPSSYKLSYDGINWLGPYSMDVPYNSIRTAAWSPYFGRGVVINTGVASVAPFVVGGVNGQVTNSFNQASTSNSLYSVDNYSSWKDVAYSPSLQRWAAVGTISAGRNAAFSSSNLNWVPSIDNYTNDFNMECVEWLPLQAGFIAGNSTDRQTFVSDANGTTFYSYGNLSEVSNFKTYKIVAKPNSYEHLFIGNNGTNTEAYGINWGQADLNLPQPPPVIGRTMLISGYGGGPATVAPMVSVATNGSVYVAVPAADIAGEGAQYYYTSTDGKHWTERLLYDALFSGGRMVYILGNFTWANGDGVLKSTNGVSWALTAVPGSTATYLAVENAFYPGNGNIGLLLVGEDATYGYGAATSLSGTGSWVQRYLPGRWYDVAKSGGGFRVVVGWSGASGGSGSAYSNDGGATWTIPDVGMGNNTLADVDYNCTWRKVTNAGGIWVAVGGGGEFNSAISYDGINWGQDSGSLHGVDAAVTWQSVIYNGMYVAAVGSGGGANSRFAVMDLVSLQWGAGLTLRQRFELDVGEDWYGLCPRNGFPESVCVGGRGWYNSCTIADTQQQESTTCPKTLFCSYPSAGAYAPSLNRYVVLCGSVYGYQIWYNGSNVWSQGGLLYVDFNTIWKDVTWSPTLSLFVAVGDTVTIGGTYPIAWSTNGYNWNPLVSGPSYAQLFSVVWSTEGYFWAQGNMVGGYYSTDGKNWNSVSAITDYFQYFYDIYAKTGYILGQNGLRPAVVTVGSGGTTYAGDYYNTVPMTPVKIGSSKGNLLLPSGNVMFSPCGSSNICEFNPVTLAMSNITLGAEPGFSGLVNTPNGNVVAIPQLNSNIISISPTARTYSNIVAASGFEGGVLTRAGNVVLVPNTSSNIGTFNPKTLVYSNISNPLGSSFSGGALIPSGQVVFCPKTSSNVGIFDTFVPSSQEFCLSPYFNKF